MMRRLFFRLFSRAFPADVRRRYGAEMMSVFEYELALARSEGGHVGALIYLLRAYADLVLSGYGERRLDERDRASWGGGMHAMRQGVTVRRSDAGPGTGWLRDVAQDVRFGVRGLMKARGFTTIAVFSLAIGIGVNTAIFSFVESFWLQSLPGIAQPERVVEVLLTDRGRDVQEWSYPDFLDTRAAPTALDELAGWKSREGSLSTEAGGLPVRMMYVTPSYFRVLGLTPAVGRGFGPGEDGGPGEHPVAVVSHDMWQDRLGGDVDLVGQTISLNRTPYTVVGILPEGFRGHRPLASATDVWLPMMQIPYIAQEVGMPRDRARQWMLVLGRLRPGATVSEANASLQTVFTRLASEYPGTNENVGARAAALRSFPAMNRGSQMAAVGLLVGFVGLVLLIICGNVAGMVLARSATRERELAVRMAIGSGRGRLIRQLMVEALLLAGAGGGLGVIAAVWGTTLASASGFAELMPSGQGTPNLSVLWFSLALTAATTMVFGLLPALRFTRPELVSSLKDDAGGGGSRVGRVHRVAVSAQAGMALLLLVTAGLFTRALGVMDDTDIGYDPAGMVVATMDISQEGYDALSVAGTFLDAVEASVGSVPTIESVAIADGFPLDRVGNYTGVSRADQSDEGGRVTVEFTRVGAGYFETMGTALLQGRGIVAADEITSEQVVVITQSLGELLFPGEEVVGRDVRIPLGLDGVSVYRIVGVTGHTASSRATEDQPHVFFALRQQFSPRIRVLARSSGDPTEVLDAVRSAILSVDPGLTPPIVVTSEATVYDATQVQRQTARIAAGLGLLALLLSAIGVYGVVGFAVVNRTREIGLRIAMGATRGSVLGGVVTDAIRLAVPGLVIGGIASVAFAAVSGSILLGVSPLDPMSLLGAVMTILVVIVGASFAPARRAAAVDPVEALRWE